MLRIVPKIDLAGFEHRIVDRRIRLRNGILEEPGRPAEDRSPRPAPRLAAAPAVIPAAIRIDRQRLQGVWGLVSGAVGGRPGGAGCKVRWTLAGDQIVMEMSDRWVGKWTLDPTRSPKRINLAAMSADGAATEEIRGVYEVRGDRLCVCLAFGDDPRPENLCSSPGTSQVSLALKRQ
jgi:uncharacterized protein (TIGR03067 family)